MQTNQTQPGFFNNFFQRVVCYFPAAGKERSKQFFFSMSCKIVSIACFWQLSAFIRHADTVAQLAIHLKCNFSSSPGTHVLHNPRVFEFAGPSGSEAPPPLLPSLLLSSTPSSQKLLGCTSIHVIDFAPSPYQSFSRHVMFTDKLCSPKTSLNYISEISDASMRERKKFSFFILTLYTRECECVWRLFALFSLSRMVVHLFPKISVCDFCFLLPFVQYYTELASATAPQTHTHAR